MNKSERRKLVDAIVAQTQVVDREQQAYISYFVQHRPYTFVEITYFTSVSDKTVGYGFAKVNWTDEWSPEYGKELATKKAAAHVVKQLGDGDNGCGCECGCRKAIAVDVANSAPVELTVIGYPQG